MEDEIISKVSAYSKTRALAGMNKDGSFKKNNLQFLVKNFDQYKVLPTT